MSDRTLKQLVGALAIVAALWAVVTLFSGGGSGSIAASGALADFFDEVEIGAFDSVRFERADEALVLTRRGSGWRANGFAVDSAAVAGLLGAIPDFEVGELIATNPSNHDRMGVSADSAVSVTFFDDDDARSILVGDAGRRFGTAYVRLPERDEVHLLEGDLRSYATRTLDRWRNRRMVALDTAAVRRIEVDLAAGGYSLIRGDSAWTFTGGDSVSATAVGGILSELSGLMATGFLAEGDSLAGLPRASTSRAYGEEDALLAEITIGEGSGNRWARSSEDSYLYEISSFRAGRVAPPREEVEPGS